eukprot:TRINITY_DN26015_c0_g1_i1.p1 TRINITY_DN26015_c0_g1~~TRINITY_DN26015_c0_g1_i1.p1  ORF type:complete len:215 (-),score=48.19 TRINITY_DN26015_c0_g1_i1:8-628(-)
MSFIVVKYGKDQERVFNTNCKSINLMTCARDVCGFPSLHPSELDLAEEATGLLMFMPSSAHDYANTLLQPRGIYVLVSLHKDEHGHAEYVPLLDPKYNFSIKLKSARRKDDSKKKQQPMLEKVDSIKIKHPPPPGSADGKAGGGAGGSRPRGRSEHQGSPGGQQAGTPPVAASPPSNDKQQPPTAAETAPRKERQPRQPAAAPSPT